MIPRQKVFSGLLFYVLSLAASARALSAPAVNRETFEGKCVGVSDGDTITVLKNGKSVRIRLEGIDCPELGQAFGTVARRFTSVTVFGNIVRVREVTVDVYGRTVARVYAEGRDLSLELVKAGMAWRYRAYSSDPALIAAEEQARELKKGLWAQSDPIPPWEYRKSQRRRQSRPTL